MSIAASVEGVDRLVETLDDAGQQLQQLAPPGGDDLVTAAVPRTPRDRGLLVQTVRATVVDQTLVLTAGGGVVDYASIVHADRPWLADTVRDQADQVIAQTADQVETITTTIQGA